MLEKCENFSQRVFQVGGIVYEIPPEVEDALEEHFYNGKDNPFRQGNRTEDQYRADIRSGRVVEFAVASAVDGVTIHGPVGGDIDPGNKDTFAVDLLDGCTALRVQCKSFGPDDYWSYGEPTYRSILNNMDSYDCILACGSRPLDGDWVSGRVWEVVPKIVVPVEFFAKWHGRTDKPSWTSYGTQNRYVWRHHHGAVQNRECFINYNVGGIRKS